MPTFPNPPSLLCSMASRSTNRVTSCEMPGPFWNVAGDSKQVCLTPVLLLPYSCLTPVLLLPYSCLTPVLLLPYSCLTPVLLLSYSCLTPVLAPPYYCLTPVLLLS
nr:hypothetical protein BgiMline_019262 [Biomphalaria glabrata]